MRNPRRGDSDCEKRDLSIYGWWYEPPGYIRSKSDRSVRGPVDSIRVGRSGIQISEYLPGPSPAHGPASDHPVFELDARP